MLLLQVMEDEFSMLIEDGSAREVAVGIMRLRKACQVGETEYIEQWYKRWQSRMEQRTVTVVDATTVNAMNQLQLNSDE